MKIIPTKSKLSFPVVYIKGNKLYSLHLEGIYAHIRHVINFLDLHEMRTSGAKVILQGNQTG